VKRERKNERERERKRERKREIGIKCTRADLNLCGRLSRGFPVERNPLSEILRNDDATSAQLNQ
jgi:hypothetical protein